MTKVNGLPRFSRSSLDPIPTRPVFTRLPRERRNLAHRKALERRIHEEYEKLPTLCLTLPQATKLFNIPSDAASARILGEFIEEGWLCINDSGHYVRDVRHNPLGAKAFAAD